jgi:hypothetical protein
VNAPTKPEVGMGATVLHYTDREAGTITYVHPNGRALIFQRDKATRTDSNGMSECQSYRYEPDPNGRKLTFTLRANGRWVLAGQGLHKGTRLHIGDRAHYHDYSF